MKVFVYAFLLYFVPLSLQNEECFQARDKGDKSCGETGGLRFYYDTRTKHCQPFLYEGCNGNTNRFESAGDCRSKCSNVSMDDAETNDSGVYVLSVPKCAGNVRAAINDKSVALKCSECPENHECVDELCCPNKEAVCELEYDTGKYALHGSHHSPRYFYSKSVNNCLLFTYYGALGNSNNFENYNDCINFCHAK